MKSNANIQFQNEMKGKQPYTIKVVNHNISCQGIPSIHLLYQCFLVLKIWNYIFELFQWYFTNALDVVQHVNKTPFHVVILHGST